MIRGPINSAKILRLAPIAFGIVVVLGKGTHAQPAAENSDTATTVSPSKKSAWRGSTLTYRNAASALSIDKSAELTYNPYWGMSLDLAPRFWFDDNFYVGAGVGISHELTKPDDTTRAHETLLGDVSLSLGAASLASLPGGINLSGSVGFTFPTSLASQGATMLTTVSPGVRLSKSFKVLEGLSIGYSLRFTKLFHEYTTGELESPIVGGCVGAAVGGCDQFLNNGVRNASFRLTNTLDLGLGLTPWLSFSTSFGVAISWLYDDVEDSRVNFMPLESQDERYALIADLGFTASPLKALDIRLGASTVNPQLAPDSTYYAPYFNRFTTLYLDLQFNLAALFSAL